MFDSLQNYHRFTLLQNSVYCPDETIIWPCVCEKYGLESNSGMLVLHSEDRLLTDEEVTDILQVFVS